MTDDIPERSLPPDDRADEPDGAATGADDAAPGDSRANPFDAWLAEAPAAPSARLCPWCSSPLGATDTDECPSCGARLRGEEAREIPGLTVVDQDTLIRRSPARKPSNSAGVLAWITGDSDLVRAASPGERPSPDTLEGARPPSDPGAAMGLAPEALLGPSSPDAVAPPDARVRREMWRIAAGLADDEPTTDVGPLPDAAAVPVESGSGAGAAEPAEPAEPSAGG